MILNDHLNQKLVLEEIIENSDDEKPSVELNDTELENALLD